MLDSEPRSIFIFSFVLVNSPCTSFAQHIALEVSQIGSPVRLPFPGLPRILEVFHSRIPGNEAASVPPTTEQPDLTDGAVN